MGRKPLPTNLKLLRGNPGKRPLNRNEPKPDLVVSAVEAPIWLEAEAKEEWSAQLPYLSKNKVLGQNELSILAVYCDLMGQYVTERKSGRTLQAALIGQMRALASELGIGPSARSKMKAGGANEANVEEKRFFGS